VHHVAKAISWRLEDEKIILAIILDEGKEIDVEIPLDIYKEILIEGPPSEEKQLRAILDKVNEIQKKRVLNIGKIDEDLGEIIKKMGEAYDNLSGTSDRIEILKYSAMIRTLAGQKAALDTRRHLVRLLYQEEGKLRAQLARMRSRGS